jgi:hypothetical protein
MEAWKTVYGCDYKLSLCLVQLKFIVACRNKGNEASTPVVQKFVTRVAVCLAHFLLFCMELGKRLVLWFF